nr:ribonuclease H-like domain-containing protein [Tanacetum cinerariifolium]
MRIEQYIQMMDYALWDIIENGKFIPKTQTINNVETVIPPTTADEKLQRRNEVKARSTLMMGLPTKHQLKFNSFKDAKSLLVAIEKRFGGNGAIKKTQRNLLKQQYGNLSGSSSKCLDQTFDKLQNLVSKLELLGEVISQEDINQKFLRSLPSEWGMHVVVWINKPDLDILSMDDLYNNLKIYDNGVNTTQEVNTANGVNTASSQEMDLKWQMAMLTMREKIFLKNTRRKWNLTRNDSVAFNKTKVECYNCNKRGYSTREYQAPRGQDNRSRDVTRKTMPVETPNSSALVSCDGLGGYDWSDQAEEGPTYYALMAYSTLSTSSLDFEVSAYSKSCLKAVENLKSTNEKLLTDLRKSEIIVVAYKEGLKSVEQRLELFKTNESNLNKIIECQIVDNYKKGLGYNAVPPPHTGLFPPSKSDLSSTGLEKLFNEPKIEKSNDKSNELEPQYVRKHSDALIIKDWVSDDEEEEVEKQEVKPSINRINFVKATTYNNPKETVKTGEQPKQNTHRKRGNQRNWNGMMSHRPKQKLTALKNSYANKKVITVWVKKVNTAKPKATVNAAKAKATYNDVKGKIDYKEIDRGYVAFGENPKGGKITGKGDPTCLFAKATEDESKLWHRRLRHLDFKTINKLVKGNLVRGLPFKIFKNDQSCVACHKRKQYRASCKTKVKNSISTPLHLLHMDLFGPTFVKRLNKKMYCLVVADDYSRFTWVFFLGTNDETSGTLKSFITRVENLMNPKVKVIRCDNRTGFKNKEMNQFCEVKGSGPNCLFDIDALTKTMNYQPVTADSPFSTTSKSSQDNEFQPSNDGTKRVDEDLSKENEFNPQRDEDSTNNTNRVNTVTSNINAASSNGVNAVGTNISINLCPDPNMLSLEDIGIFEDSHDEDAFGAEADFYNLDSIFQVSPIPTTRIHKDHPLEQVIRDSHLAPQTRRMSKNLEEHGLVGTVILRSDNKDLQSCLFVCFLSQLEPKKELQALKDLRKRAIGSKWVFRNKMDERGIIIRNKARLVAQGHTREEGMDYDEVVAPVARIEAIRLFLAYASFKDFIVYQMDVKSAFLYGKIEEEVYVCHSPGFEDPDFPDKVYKVEKALYGLHQAPRAWPDIMFAVCACARYQVTPKVSHLHAVKRIFRYLKGQPKLGLWYPKDFPFDLVAYTGSDYAGTMVANSTTEVEYIAVSSCSGQMKVNVVRHTYYCQKKVNAAKHKLTTAEKPLESDGFEEIVDFLSANQIKYALTVSPTIYTPDGKKVVITEASIRHDLKLKDVEGTSCLPNAVIFKEWGMRNHLRSLLSTKLSFTTIEVLHSYNSTIKHKPRRKERKERKVSPTEIHTEDHVPTTSNDPLPNGGDRLKLKELMVLCINLSNKVLDLENEVIEIKSCHKAKIAEVESRVEKLEEENKSLTKEPKSFNTRVESLAIKETVVDKEESSKQGRKIADIDADREINLENVYNLDKAHNETVLSMQDVIDADVSTAGGKINAANKEPISAAPTNITTAQLSEATKTIVDITTTPKAKGIVLHDMEDSTTRTTSTKSQVKDKGKAKLVEEPEVLKSRKAQIAIDEEVARRIEAEWNAGMKDNIDWNEVVKQVQSRKSDAINAERIKDSRKRARKEKVEKDQTIKKQKGNELKQDNTKKQKLEEQQEAEELKRNLEIVPNDEDAVFVNVTPLSSKPPTIVDYKIYKEGKNEHFQIIRANGNHHMYLAFSTMLKNFDREDLKVLWKIVKDRFKESQPKEVLDVFLWHTLNVMFEHTIEDNYPLAEKMYPLTIYTLQKMFNEVRLQVDYEVEMAYDLLRLVRKQLREGYVS